MRILGIDSATLVAGIAIIDVEKVLVEGFLQTRKTHSEKLLPLINYWLKEAEISLDELDGIAVTIGPGSFTGLRIGIATAKGIAMATGKPIIGIPTLDAIALNMSGYNGLICPILNARKSEVYTCLYISTGSRRFMRISEYIAVSPEQMLDWLKNGTWPLIDAVEIISDQQKALENKNQGMSENYFSKPVIFLGDGVSIYWDLILNSLGERAEKALSGQNSIRAVQVAQLGQQALNSGRVDDYRWLKPIYVRDSEAEVKWRIKHGKEGLDCK